MAIFVLKSVSGSCKFLRILLPVVLWSFKNVCDYLCYEKDKLTPTEPPIPASLPATLVFADGSSKQTVSLNNRFSRSVDSRAVV